METTDYEKLCISLVLRHPDSEKLIAEKMILKVSPDKFGGSENKVIWQTIKYLIEHQRIPDTGNVIAHLGGKLDDAGGEVYIRSLFDFAPQMKIEGFGSYETYCEVVNNAGILRQVGLVAKQYGGKFDEFEKLVRETKDVNLFLNNFMTDLQDGFSALPSHYVPISVAVEEAMIKIEQARQGNSDILICGMPSLQEYGVPYGNSFGVIQGFESKGKTQLAIQIGVGKAIHLYDNKQPGIVAIDTLEMTRSAIATRIACFLAGVDSMELREGSASETDYKRIYEKLEYVEKLPIEINHFIIDTDELKWQAIAQNIKQPRVLGISDYAELFKDDARSEEQRLSKVTRNIKSLTKIVGSAEIMITQVNRDGKKTNNKQIGIGGAKGASTIEQAADWYLEVMNYPAMTGAQMNFVCPSHRNEELAYGLLLKHKEGRLGEIEFRWTPKYTRFVDNKVPMGQVYNFAVVEENDCGF